MTRRNVHPSVWGRPAWQFLEACAEACDAPSAPHYEAFVRLLPYVMPCEKCRLHAAKYIEEHPPDTADLKGWLRRFQEHVSQQKQRTAPSSAPLPARCEMPSRGLARPGVLLALLLFFALFAVASSQLMALLRR